MDKYITSIKDIVYNSLTNRIGDDDEASKFQLGMVHLLGIGTPVDFKRASQFFGNSSLKDNSDANRMLGFIAECEGDFSSAFKYYALSAELTKKTKDCSQLQKVIQGRDELQKIFSKFDLPMTFNGVLSNVLGELNKGNAKTKQNSRIISALVSEEQLTCKEIANELLEAGDIYSAKLLLMKGNIDKNDELYQEINKRVSQYQVEKKNSKGAVVELEDSSILPDYDKLLSIADIKKKCLEEVKSCSNQWKSSSKTIIDKATKSQKRKIAKEKTEKKNKIMGIIFLAIVPLILFVALWIYFASITAAAAIIFFYYCICVFVAIKM
jgi:hypothetical protein